MVYACAEGSDHLPIAHALRLPEPTNKKTSSGCVPPLRSGPLAALTFGRRKVSGRKKKKKERKNNAKFSDHYFRSRTHNVRTKIHFWINQSR